MDRETKAAFSGVNKRLDQHEALLVRLAEGQVKHDTAIAGIESSLTRAAGLLNTLAGEVQQLAQAQQRTEATVQQLAADVRQLAADVRQIAP